MYLTGPSKICPEGTKLYGYNCLDKNLWNDLIYWISDVTNQAWLVLDLLFLTIFVIFSKKYIFKRNVPIWKRILGLFAALTISFLIFFLVVLFGQIFNVNLLRIY